MKRAIIKFQIVTALGFLALTACEKQGADPGTEAPVKVTLSGTSDDNVYSSIDNIDLAVKVVDLNGNSVSTDIDVEVLNNEGYKAQLSSVSVNNGIGSIATSGSELNQVAKANSDLDLSVAALNLIAKVNDANMRWPFDINVNSAISEIDAPAFDTAGHTVWMKYTAETFVNYISNIEIQSKVNEDGTYSTIQTKSDIDAMTYNDSVDIVLPAAGSVLYLKANISADNGLTDSRETMIQVR